MWLLLAFLSATLLGFYDVFKKQSLKDNAVLPVLFLNTFFPVLSFCLSSCCPCMSRICWEEQYLMFLLLVGNSINISLSSHSSCYPHGYSGILG